MVEDVLAGRRIGPHLPLHNGMLKQADRAHEIGATCVQVFVDNPTAWRRRTAPPPELGDFRERLSSYDIAPVAVHGPYLINLCGADPDFWQRSVDTLVGELAMGAAYGAKFVNIHIGSHRGLGRERGLENLVRGLSAAIGAEGTAGPADATTDGSRPLIVLENSAGTGDGVGATIADLAQIDKLAETAGIGRRFAFCVDTAHLWAAGHKIDSASGVGDLVALIDAELGRDRVQMMHLNDARMACGSHIDRHEHIGAGAIGEAGMRALLENDWLRTLPTYLETPGMDDGYDGVNLERVRLLLRHEPLPQLPDSAFVPRTGRMRRRVPAAVRAAEAGTPDEG